MLHRMNAGRNRKSDLAEAVTALVNSARIGRSIKREQAMLIELEPGRNHVSVLRLLLVLQSFGLQLDLRAASNCPTENRLRKIFLDEDWWTCQDLFEHLFKDCHFTEGQDHPKEFDDAERQYDLEARIATDERRKSPQDID
jgi:hypothetical protein